MPKLVRKQVTMTEAQAKLLERTADALHVPQSEVVRRGVEQIGALRAAPLDRSAWLRELKFIRKRARLASPGGGRRWTREELYEERVGPDRRAVAQRSASQ